MTNDDHHQDGIETLLRAAVDACTYQPPGRVPVPATLLEAPEATLRVAADWFATALSDRWERGWTPADLVHVSARLLGPGHADVVATQSILDARRRGAEGQPLHRRWHEQLATLEDRAVRRGYADDLVVWHVEALALLATLPDVPRTMPRPGQTAGSEGDGPIDAGLVARVRALLAKAESTTFEQEAEAFTAKAQELIARHAIDEALLRERGDVGDAAVRRIHVDDPYADAKGMIVGAVGAANRCRSVHSDGFGWVTVFGFDHDLDAVELLAVSLLAQATAAMVRHGPRRDASGRSRTRSFRRAFLLGFARRIGQRLREVTEEQVTASDDGSLAPVLAARDEVVRAAQKAAFPNLVHRTTTASNPAGWHEGEAAAERARLEISPHRLPAS
jgi:hypothetical protein